MASVTVRVDGLRELGERMRKLSEKVNKKLSAQATAAAAQIVKKSAKQHIQTSPSMVTRSLLEAVIIKKLSKNQTKLTAEHIVTVRGRGKKGKKLKGKQRSAPHAHLIEFGHMDRSGKPVPAEPFLRPAFDENRQKLPDAMKNKLAVGITKAGA